MLLKKCITIFFIFFATMHLFAEERTTDAEKIEKALRRINYECTTPRTLEWELVDIPLTKIISRCKTLTTALLKKYPNLQGNYYFYNHQKGYAETQKINAEFLLNWLNTFTSKKSGEGEEYGKCFTLNVLQFFMVQQTCLRTFDERSKKMCQDDINFFLELHPTINCELKNSNFDVDKITPVSVHSLLNTSIN